VRSVQAIQVLTTEQEMLVAVLRRANQDVSDAQGEAEGEHFKGGIGTVNWSSSNVFCLQGTRTLQMAVNQVSFGPGRPS
jgi:hypothetical protein